MARRKFFGTRQHAAVLKHEILRRYLPMYVRKTGSRGARVSYVDGYAGPGKYDDGAPGSPAVAVATARIVQGTTDRIDGYFIEKDQSAADALAGFLADANLKWPVLRGSVEQKLPSVMAGIDAKAPLFVFLDPFGLGVPLSMLRDEVLARSGPVRYGYRTQGAATEVLLNFSFPGLRRTAGHLTSTKTTGSYPKARQTAIARVDATLGGTWWHSIWSSEDADREEQIFNGYLERLRGLPGNWGWFSVPVSDRWDGPTEYCLILLTQHSDGRWLFHEAVSNALEPYRQICLEGTLDLEPLDVREARWIAELEANITRLLTQGKAFVVQDRMKEVFGKSFGFAREKHVKRAIKSLYKAGVTSTTGVGDIQRMTVKPPQ